MSLHSGLFLHKLPWSANLSRYLGKTTVLYVGEFPKLIRDLF